MSYLNHVLGYFDLARNYRNYQLDLIRKFVGGNILEVGPGRGEIIENFISADNKITMIDTDEEMCKVIRERFKNSDVKILNSNISSLEEKFDTILYMDVIEHIENDIKELDQAISKLNKNGKLVIIVPAFSILFSDFDKSVGHFRRYTKKNFFNYKNSEVKLRNLKYFDSLGFFILFLSKILKFKGNSKAVFGIKVWNMLIPISRLIDKIIFHSLGKSLICVYEKI
tara:strand:+ start:43 stop:720 length:678 start_codon:yes stop_codon:yes gene_type:complete